MKLKEERVLYCDPAQSELVTEYGFGPAYDWLAEQMVLRVGQPPAGVKYPFWAWHTVEWKHRKPDLRRMEFRNYSGNQVCIELEVPDKDVLLSNEDMWHLVLNDGYYGDCSNEQEYEAEDKWYNSLLPVEQLRVKQKSWEKKVALLEECDRLLESEHCHNTVVAMMAKGKGFSVARRLGIDHADKAFHEIQNDFYEQYDRAPFGF